MPSGGEICELLFRRLHGIETAKIHRNGYSSNLQMHCHSWQGNKRLLSTIFCIITWSLRWTIALQSKQFFSIRQRSTMISGFNRRVVTCCRVDTKTNLDENKPVQGNSTTASLIFMNKEGEEAEEKRSIPSRKRRDMVLSTVGGVLGVSETARAVDNIFSKKGLYVLNTRDEESASSSWNEQVEVFPKLSSEHALLRVLPVKNTVFRTVEQNLEALSVLRYRSEANKETVDKAWAKADTSVDTILNILTNKRKQLEPVFNPDDTPGVAAMKTERGETLLSSLRQDLEYLKEAIQKKKHHLRLSRATKCFIEPWILRGVAR
mmetsp:Transcript_17089/g.39451  ORF Transcript_17089/g.39451 Transcript_17089/m.39451 type:complete len:320 (+) Transcript_17089:104-1063(+)